ncbi:hypothetical protein FOMA001_g7245 [Fusarium oxysporum f. sp. matthiolae]|nr:hypothetical protein FOMA001_g7245 [Fusarium oxysporum f. sp. matthiolae]
MRASLVADLIEKIATAHPLVVTQPEHLASKLVLTWHTFLMSGAKDKSFIDMMLHTLESSSVDLKYGPQTRNDGETAFFDFDSELTEAQSVEVIREMSTLNAKLANLDPKLVMTVHKALRTSAKKAHNGNADNVGDDDNGDPKLGDELPHNALAFFLESCRDVIVRLDFHEDVILKGVSSIIPYCKRYSNNCPRTPLQDVMSIEPTTPHPVTSANFRVTLLALKSYLQASAAHANRAVELVAGQHGALLKHATMDILMKRLGNATDIPNATSLFEQVSALHATHYGIIHQTAAQGNEDMVSLIDKMLHSIESTNPSSG